MAEGILALLGKPKKGGDEGDDSSSDSEPSTRKARAVRDMFKAADEEDWDTAAEMFHRAYVECHKKLEGDEGEGDSSDDSDYEEEE